MRVDKYLKAARILKRRTVSRQLAENQRIEVNGRIVKPAKEVYAGDIITVTSFLVEGASFGTYIEPITKEEKANLLVNKCSNPNFDIWKNICNCGNLKLVPWNINPLSL